MQDQDETKGSFIRKDSNMLRKTANVTDGGPIIFGYGTMSMKLDPKDVLAGVILVCGMITALMGGLVLAGWVGDWDMLTSMRTDYIPMAPNTAMLFIILGVALVVDRVWSASPIAHTGANAAAILTLIVTGMSLMGLVLDLDLEIGHWLLPSAGTFGTVPIGHMSPITSFSFIFSGSALLLLGRQTRDSAGIMGTLVMLVGWVNMTGYWYGAPLLYGGTVIPVALPTSLAFVLLGAGLVAAAGSQAWPLSIFSGPTTRSLLMRGLLPAILVVILIHGLVNLMLLNMSVTSVVLETAVIDIVTVLAVFIVASRLSRKIGDTIDRAEQQVRESEEKYRSLFEDSVDGIFITATDGTLIDANQSFLDLFGYTKEEMLEISVIKLYPNPEDRNRVTHDLVEIGSIKDYPLRFLRKDGAGMDCLLTATARKTSEGRILGYRGIIRDITERKLMEEKLEKSEHLYRTLFESAGDSIYVVDLEGDTPGKIVSANQATSQMHGYTLDELLGMTVFDLDTEESAKKGPERVAKLLKGETLREEVTHRRKDGAIFPLEINASLLQLGDHTYGIAIDRDISDRKAAELALKASEERMRILIEVSPVGIRVARKGSYIYANPAFARMFGYDNPDEIIGLPVTSLYIPEERELIRKLAKGKPIGSQVPSYYEVTGQTKDGKRLDLTIWVARIDFDGEPATLGFVVDVSSEKSLRTQLIQAQKMESLGNLAGGIAHDFNNLLQIVIGYSELILSSRQISEKVKSDIGKINHAAQDGAELAKRLLAFSSNIEIDKRHINLNDRMQRIKGMLARTIPKTIEIILRPVDDLKMVNADPTQIDQVLLNLAINARDAMPDGGRLTISTANATLDEEYCRRHMDAVPGDYAVLMVSDTGHGMHEHTREHIFEPFFTTKEVGKGTGLGLSIVYGVIKQHDGFIECCSKLSKGTTFKIYLPAISEQANGLEKAVLETEVKGGTETILLVDDSEFVRDLGVRLFSEAGYTVITAVNGVEGIEVFQRERGKISLVILDLIMPQMDGVKCLEEIIKIDSTAKVVIASGFTVDEETGKIIESSTKGFIRKPFILNEALRTVRQVLDSG